LNNNTKAKCKCKKTYFGEHCENREDICKQRNCSGHGYCFINQTTQDSQCKCFINYSGLNCTIADTFSIVTLKTVQTTSVILAICVLIITIKIIVSFDVLNYFGIGLKKIKPPKHVPEIKKTPKYVQFKKEVTNDEACTSSPPKLLKARNGILE
jgi:hypothetical protein